MANPGWDRLWRIGPPVMSVRDRLRLGLATILILVGSALLGRFIDGLLIGLGTYTVLFGAIPSRPHRARVMASAGIGLIAAVGVGVAVSSSLALTLGAFVLAAFAGLALDTAMRLGPPGPYFFVLMVGGGTIIGRAGLGVTDVVAPLAAGAVVAFIAAVLGADKTGNASPDTSATADTSASPDTPATQSWARSFRERLTWPHPEAVMFARVVVAATLAFAIPVMAGGTHPFWAVLVAVLVLSYPGGRRIQVMRAIHRILGTALGFLAYWGWTLIHPPDVVTFAAMGILLWITMGLAAGNYGLACIAITLLALMMTQVLTRTSTRPPLPATDC